eukprot:647701-Rhodomonas_salina.1
MAQEATSSILKRAPAGSSIRYVSTGQRIAPYGIVVRPADGAHGLFPRHLVAPYASSVPHEGSTIR